MSVQSHARLGSSSASSGLLSRERIVAGQKFNRWLVPPAALAIHLCIGMAYGFTVFWLPMTRLIAERRRHRLRGAELRRRAVHHDLQLDRSRRHPRSLRSSSPCSGISAAIWGGWLEHAGPRKAGFIAALCWGGGLVLLRRFGVRSISCGWCTWRSVICGVGQGLGYITPVSTLIKWFPDRRGMATGFAIMGYGGGAMIGAPLAVWLMARLRRQRRTGRRRRR